MLRKLVLPLSFVMVISLACTGFAGSFRFTATADPRDNRNEFQHLLRQITDKVLDEGIFHITCGDYDPADDSYRDLVTEFGSDVAWYPVLGNHDLSPSDLSWVHNNFATFPYIVNQGPSPTETTTYSFDYGIGHFVVLNEYYDGARETGTNGDADDALYNWLLDDLAATTQPAIFVFGHEPAFPEYRHVGDSLDGHPANRDRFWKLLNDTGVVAYICGHTHTYYAKQVPGRDWENFTWQIDLGNAGNGSPNTFLDVTVNDNGLIEFDTWQGQPRSSFAVVDAWAVQVEATPDPDFNRDGIINFLDLTILLDEWLR